MNNYKILKLILVSYVFSGLIISNVSHSVEPLEGKTFGDWVVLCDDELENKRCSMSQIAALGSTGEQLMRIDIEFSTPFSNAEIRYILPLGISLDTYPALFLDGKKREQLQMNYCVADGCYSTKKLSPAMLESILHMTTGKLSFETGSGEPVSLPVSGKGSRAAFNSTQ